MYRNLILGNKLLAILVIAGATLASPLEGQRSGVEIWAGNCGRCHMIQPVNRYGPKAWADIGQHMSILARLTSDESTAVIEFLQGAARRIAAQEALEQTTIASLASLTVAATAPRMADPADIYAGQCAACHGKDGKGDGVAAVAFNPKPVSFVDSEFAKTRTLDQVIAGITDGKSAMPPFGDAIPPEEIRALAEYVLKLSEGGS